MSVKPLLSRACQARAHQEPSTTATEVPPLKRSLSDPTDSRVFSRENPTDNPELSVVLTRSLHHLNITTSESLRRKREFRSVRAKSENSAIVYRPPTTFVPITSPPTRAIAAWGSQTPNFPPTPDDRNVTLFLTEGFFTPLGRRILPCMFQVGGAQVVSSSKATVFLGGAETVRSISRAFYNGVEQYSLVCVNLFLTRRLSRVRTLLVDEPATTTMETYKDSSNFRKCQVFAGRINRVLEVLDMEMDVTRFLSLGGNLQQIYNLARLRVISYNSYAYEVIQDKLTPATIRRHGIDLAALVELNPFEAMLILQRLMDEEAINLRAGFYNRTNLRELTFLPKPFFDNSVTVCSMNLEGNKLRELSSRFRVLTNLTSLKLGNNDLRSLPLAIMQHPRLRSLHVEGNRNLVFDENAPLPANLECLDISDIPFDSIPAPILQKLIEFDPNFDLFCSEEMLSQHAACQLLLIKIIDFLRTKDRILKRYQNIGKFLSEIGPRLSVELLQSRLDPYFLCHRFFRAATYETSSFTTSLRFERLLEIPAVMLDGFHSTILRQNAQSLRFLLRNIAMTYTDVSKYVDFEMVNDLNTNELEAWAENVMGLHPQLIEILGKIEVLVISEPGTLSIPIEMTEHCTNLKTIILGPDSYCQPPNCLKKRLKWEILKRYKGRGTQPYLFYTSSKERFDSTGGRTRCRATYSTYRS